MPRIINNHQKLEKARTHSSLKPEGAQSNQQLDFGLLASRTIRKISLISGNPICGTSLWKIQSASTALILGRSPQPHKTKVYFGVGKK